MFTKLAVVAAFVALVSAQGSKYPAGVNPSLCPNYPDCDNSLLAAYNQPGSLLHYPLADGYPVGLSPAACPNYPYCGATPIVTSHHGSVHHGSAHHGNVISNSYPDGVNPATCPNYPFCSNHIPSLAAPLLGFSSRQYPDGVNPSSCPNYPYCH